MISYGTAFIFLFAVLAVSLIFKWVWVIGAVLVLIAAAVFLYIVFDNENIFKHRGRK